MRSEALEEAPAPYVAPEDDKRLHVRFTTGTTAVAVVLAMATLLFSGERLEAVSIRTLVGAVLSIPIEPLELVTEDGVTSAVAAVRKDAGNDPNVTDGLLFCVHVDTEESAGTEGSEETEIPVAYRAGMGIGTVIKPGLDQPVDEAAINRVPRNMVTAVVRSAYQESSFKSLPDTACTVVILSCPEGEEEAKKTFNPKLGIQGGLLILGAEGIVRPMSRRVLIEAIVTDVKLHLAVRPYFLAVSGSYGFHFLEGHFGVGAADPVVMNNFIGETLDTAIQYGAKGVLLAGHIRKLVKLTGGTINMHSREADCRLELFVIYAFRVDAPKELVTVVLQTGLMTEIVRPLEESGFLEATSESLLVAMERAVVVWTRGETEVGILLYTLEDGVLAEGENAQRLMERSTET